jgi:hypothetical protein
MRNLAAAPEAAQTRAALQTQLQGILSRRGKPAA